MTSVESEVDLTFQANDLYPKFGNVNDAKMPRKEGAKKLKAHNVIQTRG